MRPYEIMVIFDAGADPPAIQAVIERALEAARSKGGSPGNVDRWGRRPFAYEVRHRREGYYVVIELSASPEIVADLDRMLGLADEVLRHKVIRIPDKVAQGRSRSSREPATASASSSSPLATVPSSVGSGEAGATGGNHA